MKRDALLPPPADPAKLARATPAWRALHRMASAPYRRRGDGGTAWAWHWARGKLGRDPVFRHLLESGTLPAQARVVDIGCGQGLMASLLAACEQLAGSGAWPVQWPPAPSARAYTGIELMDAEARRGQRALRHLPFAPQIICADMREATLPACDLVVILDVLHYVDHAAQRELLLRVRAALADGGRLLLRVGDSDDARGYAISQWVDRVVTLVRGHRVAPVWGRSLTQWITLLRELGFTVRSQPMSRGTPFANVLLVADLPGIAR